MWRMKAAQHSDPVAFHAEGPLWWPDDGSEVAGMLRWVDLINGQVLTDAPAGIIRADVGSSIAAFLRPRRGGGAVVATEHGLSIADDARLDDLKPFAELIDDPAVRLNEGGCAPDGALLVGAMRYDAAPGGGRLIEILPDGTASTVREDVTVSNGIAWSPDGSLAYYNDTPSRQTAVYSWDPERRLHDPRRFFALGDGDDAVGPDGLCVDVDGNVWTAIYGGSRVECHDPSGRLVEVVELPVTNVTACAFGGEGFDRLFITTSRENLADDEQPEAGAVFVAEPGVRGLPVHQFGG